MTWVWKLRPETMSLPSERQVTEARLLRRFEAETSGSSLLTYSEAMDAWDEVIGDSAGYDASGHSVRGNFKSALRLRSAAKRIGCSYGDALLLLGLLDQEPQR